jgi:hypothetical protein
LPPRSGAPRQPFSRVAVTVTPDHADINLVGEQLTKREVWRNGKSESIRIVASTPRFASKLISRPQKDLRPFDLGV